MKIKDHTKTTTNASIFKFLLIVALTFLPLSNQNKNINNSNKRQKQLGRISSLGLLFPQSFNNNTNKQQHPIVYRGRSFVNLLPPPSRIEQNALPPLLCTRVNSDKFVNYMSGSPPPLPSSDLKDSSKSSSSPSSQSIQKQQQQHYQKKQNQRRRPSSVSGSNVDAISVVRHAPMRQFSTSTTPITTIISSPPSASQQQQKEEEKQLNLKMFKKDEKDEEDENTTTTNLINCSLKESTSCGDQQHEIVKRQVSNSLDVEMGQTRIRSTSTTGTASSTIDKRSTSQHNQLQEKASLKSSLKIEDTILRLNIGGSSYRIRTRSILKHGADTLLGRFIRMDEQHRRAWADAYFEEESEYFFERVPRYFDPVYDFYASGKLHVPKDLCFDKFMAELRFWSVSKAKVDQCCSPFAQYYLYKKTKNLDTPEKDHFIGLRCAKVRRRLWLILEGHSNSKWWKFFEITSTSFVVLSITALILASMPEFQVPDNSNQLNTMSLGKHSTNPTYPKVSGFTISTTTVVKDGEEHRIEMIEHPVFNYVENICVIYFTLEYLLRFWVAPIKSQFVKEFLNIIDLLAIAPFLFELLLIFIGIRGDNIRKVRWAFLTVRLLRVLRVVRIAKLGRFSPGLANFALTLQRSKKQMQMVAIVLLTVIIFFSTLVYFMEKDEPNTTFTSIPAAFWWCLFSQTKWVPQTASGKIVGGGAIICGVLVLALPIAILVNNFMQVVRLREEKLIRQQYYVTNTASGGSIVGGEHRV
uniref:Uncharacterized protein n=1 Tax=Meloidogyne enterolobii TaxID=390850 RepID=A0A6V7UJX2_MELEN|nr:unnamed protein product [Meloidogyne enterolobii]